MSPYLNILCTSLVKSHYTENDNSLGGGFRRIVKIRPDPDSRSRYPSIPTHENGPLFLAHPVLIHHKLNRHPATHIKYTV